MNSDDRVGFVVFLLAFFFLVGATAMAVKSTYDYSRYQKLTKQCVAERVNTKDICEAEAYLKVYK
jgi:hypothetical protein